MESDIPFEVYIPVPVPVPVPDDDLIAEVERLRVELASAQKQRDSLDEECREATASWCREANETLDLYRELDAMEKQRDEARELYCLERSDNLVGRVPRIDAKTIAKNRGWEGLFKEDGGA